MPHLAELARYPEAGGAPPREPQFSTAAGSRRMNTSPGDCPHESVEPRGISLSHLARWVDELEAGAFEELETAWCRECSHYVQRQLGGSAWTLMPSQGQSA